MAARRLLLSFLLAHLLVQCIRAHEPEGIDSTNFNFTGKYKWTEENLKTCDIKMTSVVFAPDPSKLFCYVNRIHLFFMKIEVLNLELPAVVYHSLIPMRLIDSFNNMVERIALPPLTVKASPDRDGNKLDEARITNGTFIPHWDYLETVEMWSYVQRRIPSFDFKASEQFQVLTYQPGGHYAPHYDFFDPTNWDVPALGNRIATFMAVLKTADEGGGTLFPNVGMIFAPEPGDAILWFNANPDGTKHMGSMHGACPIIKGKKIGMTLWIREFGQTFRMPCPLEPGKPYELERLIRPPCKKWYNSQFTVC
ncbi:Protein PHY-3 [Aphelenchoides avenae]|nr:Protein PHY-3 [Aphelenchus avenae]